MKNILTDLILFALFALFHSNVYAALAIDGTPATGNTITVKSVPVTLTTTSASDIIYLCTRADSTAGVITGVADTSLLSWSLRKAEYPSGPNTFGECWYAVAGGILSSDVITVTWTNVPSFARVLAFGISGADTSTPFDTNASIPAGGLQTGNVTTINVSSITTNNSNDMLIGSLTTTAAISATSRPSGFTQVASTGTAAFDVSYNIVSSVQSAATFTWSWTTATPANIIFDAVRQAPAVGGVNLLNVAF